MTMSNRSIGPGASDNSCGSELQQLEAFNAQYAVMNKHNERGMSHNKSRRSKRGKDGTQLSDGIVNAMVDDLRRANLEKWCRKHGCKVKLELKDKIALRKWFYSLDSDNSGEVSAEELHDPMLSTGILKTKQAVFNTIRSIDTSKIAVDFDTFSKSIMHGNADQDKLKKLQGFCENEHGFSVDTLFSIERRKLLLNTIMTENQNRHDEVDNIWNKAAPYEVKVQELRQLDDAHKAAVVEHDAYIAELQEALQLNKKDRMLKDAARAKDIEILNRLKAKEEADRNALPWLFQQNKKSGGAPAGADNFRRSLVPAGVAGGAGLGGASTGAFGTGGRKLPLMANSFSSPMLRTTDSYTVSVMPTGSSGGDPRNGRMKRDPSFS